MRNLIHNANLLDDQVGDFKINSTFETASGTTNVEIRKTPQTIKYLVVGIGLIILLLALFFIFGK
jgi:hypothetical protein